MPADRLWARLQGGRILSALALVAAAEAANLLPVALFVDCLHLPLFLDTVGTVAATFLGGLGPGLASAVLFNVLRTLLLSVRQEIYPWEMLYLLSGAAIVLCTWAFSRRKENFSYEGGVTALYLLLAAVLSALASSLVGGEVEYAIRLTFADLSYRSPTEHLLRAFSGEEFGLLASCILVRIPVTVLDRLVCTFAGFGLYRLLAARGLFCRTT